MSEWIIEKIELHLIPVLFEKEEWTCFSNSHDSHFKLWILLSSRIFLFFNFDKCRWSKRSCKSAGDDAE